MIETSRLLLRIATPKDTNSILNFINSEFSKKYNPYDSYSEIRLWKHLKDNESIAIILKETNEFIGLIGFEEDMIRINVNAISLNYVLDENYTNKGYMTEALREALRYLFLEKDYDIVSLRIIDTNLASIHIAKKLGFTYEGLIRQSIKAYDNVIYDQVIYSMTRKEFEENPLL